MKYVVAKIFGKEAAEDKEIVGFYEAVQKIAMEQYAIDYHQNQVKNNITIMTKEQIIEAIKSLTEVVKANNGWLGSESIMRDANKKIQELIKLL